MGLDGTYSSSDGSEPEEDATPSKKKAKRTPMKKTPSQAPIVIESDSEDGVAVSLPTRSNRSSAKKPKPIALTDSSEDEIVQSNATSSQRRQSSLRNRKPLHRSPMIASSSRPRRKATVQNGSDSEEDYQRSSPPKRLARLTIPDDEDEDEEDMVLASPRKRRQPQVLETEEDEDDIILPSPRKRNSRAMVETDEDESQPVMSPLKRTRQPVESDSDVALSPLKRRRNDQEVELSSDSDLPSPRTMAANVKRNATSKTPPRVTRQQKAVHRHRTEKEKTMELMKRRRAGENIEQVTESSESESVEKDEDDELQQLSEFEDEEPSPEAPRQSAKAAKRKTRINSDGEIDTDDFITDNEDGPLGVPDMSLIPLEFTSAAHKPLKEHFKDVVEWMVHNKVNPGFEWKDPIYDVAFRKVDAECGGFADSKFVSTQWTAAFTRALYARPTLILRQLNPGEGIDVLGEAKCEACNHRKHIPTWSIQFEGKAYNKVTLEEIDQDSSDDDSDDSDSDSSEDSDKASVDEKGQRLLGQDKTWFAGA